MFTQNHQNPTEYPNVWISRLFRFKCILYYYIVIIPKPFHRIVAWLWIWGSLAKFYFDDDDVTQITTTTRTERKKKTRECCVNKILVYVNISTQKFAYFTISFFCSFITSCSPFPHSHYFSLFSVLVYVCALCVIKCYFSFLAMDQILLSVFFLCSYNCFISLIFFSSFVRVFCMPCE